MVAVEWIPATMLAAPNGTKQSRITVTPYRQLIWPVSIMKPTVAIAMTAAIVAKVPSNGPCSQLTAETITRYPQDLYSYPVSERGYVTNYAYNPDGTLQSITQPAPATGAARPQTRYTYANVTLPDASTVSKLKTVSECQTNASCAGTADEVKTTFNWSNQEIPTSIVKAGGSGAFSATSTFGHDNVGNIISVDGPLAGTADTTIVRYDLMRRKIGTTSPRPSRRRRLIAGGVGAGGRIKAEVTMFAKPLPDFATLINVVRLPRPSYGKTIRSEPMSRR
jgi:hypothetical protein